MFHIAHRLTVSSRLAQLTTHLNHCAMATSTSSTIGPAPWRKLFLEHIQAMSSPEFTLSTIRKIPSPSGTVYSPRARTCIFRGLFADLPVNPKNDAQLNPDIYETDLLTFTTDCRMDKMAELFGAEPDSGKLKGSGGGAPLEAVFWVKETVTQWRVRGKAYVLSPDVEDSPEGKQVIATLTLRMRRKNSDGKEWSFGREVTAHFGNLSPLMRGSFRNPPSGSPVALPVRDDRLKLGQKVTDLNDEVARDNFRVVVIVPEEIDRCDLSDPERGRRWVYTYVGGKSTPSTPGGLVEDGWEKVEVWP
ncbi:pyridoxamine 5'-phosphate oxidase-domain-containing protein [Hypoxylon crocopeplum]|nr:pyridoxamine 5'-phosphate oxidase-domain-containing protein [Hypoxylon crocopeplum]